MYCTLLKVILVSGAMICSQLDQDVFDYFTSRPNVYQSLITAVVVLHVTFMLLLYFSGSTNTIIYYSYLPWHHLNTLLCLDLTMYHTFLLFKLSISKKQNTKCLNHTSLFYFSSFPFLKSKVQNKIKRVKSLSFSCSFLYESV